MNASSKTSNPTDGNSPKKRGHGKARAGSVAVAIVLALYALLQPYLNERYGLNLPGLSKSETAITAQEDAGTGPRSVENQSAAEAREEFEAAATPAKEPSESTAAAKTGGNGKSSGQANGASQKKPTEPKQEAETTKEDSDSELLFGILREVRHDRFLSPQGIQYNPGSAEGHRLEHLRRHIKDQPKRPGKHGVFDGGMEGALKTIDRAYERAKKKIKTTKRVEGKKTVYTVDLGGRVGFVGGREGARTRNPMARRVRIVLEGTQFITAFPL